MLISSSDEEPDLDGTMLSYLLKQFQELRIPHWLVTPGTSEIIPHLVLGKLSIALAPPQRGLIWEFNDALGFTNLSEEIDPFVETQATKNAAAFEQKHAARILAMRNCGSDESNHAALSIAGDLLMDAKNDLTAEEFGLLVAGTVGRWRFAAVWRTLRCHIIQ